MRNDINTISVTNALLEITLGLITKRICRKESIHMLPLQQMFISENKSV